MDFFNDIFHNLALLEFYFLNIIYILLYIDFILSIFFQHSNILTRASHHWCLASNIVLVPHWLNQCSAKALGKWGQMTHTTENYGDVGNFSGVTYGMFPFMNLKLLGTWAPTARIIGDIPDFNVLNVPKTQPRHNPGWTHTQNDT